MIPPYRHHDECDGLAYWAALGDFHLFSFFGVEAGWIVSWYVAFPSLISLIFRHVVKIVAANYRGFVHLSADDQTI